MRRLCRDVGSRTNAAEACQEYDQKETGFHGMGLSAVRAAAFRMRRLYSDVDRRADANAGK
jgi:hypothetical protein